MNAKEFFDLVVIARREAKAYMKDKNIEHIGRFKDAVRKIDDEIERVERIMEKKNVEI